MNKKTKNLLGPAWNGKEKGSALLVALLIMGILITLTLGLSSLVIREIRQTSDIVAAAQAYYAAEAGIEHGLMDLKVHLPGYETGDTDNPWHDREPSPGLHYRYRIQNKGDTVPYFDEDKPIFIGPNNAVTKEALYTGGNELVAQTYNVLPLNGSVTIPLFTDKGDGTSEDVTDFLIQYYVDFDLDIENIDLWSGKQIRTENFDILRWKIFGSPADNPAKTEAISDFFPAHSDDGPKNPVCIGTAEDLLSAADQYNCIVPVARQIQTNSEGQAIGLDDIPLDASWSIARECYHTDAGAVTSGMDIAQSCSIKSFITNHKRNYITLTNFVNPDIVGISNIALRASRANIYYRIITRSEPGSPRLVRDAAKISADGYAAGNTVTRSIDISFKKGTFLPVFNFSLYKTDTSGGTP